jgi:broad specificity phosphatase PhoE
VPSKEHRLILVRHSLPEFITGVPASQWRLSDEGRRRCQSLAQCLAAYEPTAIISSQEPKAIETGQICAGLLDLPFETAAGLHEHQRGVVHDLGSRKEFEAQIGHFFAQPGRLVFGGETADQAHARFSRAIAAVLAQHPAGTPAIVSHGTVMTLFITRVVNRDPLPFWKSLGLPAFAILSLPERSLVKLVTEIVDET